MKAQHQHRILLRGGTIGAALRAATGGSPAKFFKQADQHPAARLVLVTGDNRRVSI